MIWVWSYHSNPSPPPIFAQWLSGWNGLELQESHPVLKLGLAKAENSKGKWEEAGHGGKSLQVVSSHGVPIFFFCAMVCFGFGIGRVRIFWPSIFPWLCHRKCNWTQQPAKWSTCDMASDWVSHITSSWEGDKRLDHPTLYMNICSLSLWHIQYPCLLLEASGCCWCEKKNVSPNSSGSVGHRLCVKMRSGALMLTLNNQTVWTACRSSNRCNHGNSLVLCLRNPCSRWGHQLIWPKEHVCLYDFACHELYDLSWWFFLTSYSNFVFHEFLCIWICRHDTFKMIFLWGVCIYIYM